MKLELKACPPFQVFEDSEVRPAGIVIRLSSAGDARQGPAGLVSIEWDLTPDEAMMLAADLRAAVEKVATLPVNEMWRRREGGGR